MSTATGSSPWWYRARFSVFGAIYGCGFFFGYLLTGFIADRPVAAFAATGRPAIAGGVAIALALAGWAIRVWGSSYLASSIVWHDDATSDALRVSGPYRFTRNPLYLGNVVQALGVGLLAPWIGFAIVVIGVTVFSFMLVGVEERYLHARYGAAYDEYRARVPRFVPVPWKSMPDGGQTGSLAEGLRAETMIGTISVVVSVIILAMLLRR